MNVTSNPPPEVEILENLVKHVRKLALTPDPERRIVASRWQIIFERELEKVRADAMKQTELFNVVSAAPDEEPLAVNFSQQPRKEVKP